MIDRPKRRHFAAILFVFASCLSGCATNPSSNQRPMKEVRIQASVFLKAFHQKSLDLEWKKQPTLSQLERVVPSDRPGHVNFELNCQLTESGHFRSCEVPSSYPAGQRYKEVAQRLPRLFVARTDNLPGGVANVWFVILSVQLSDGSWGGPCWPPFCVSMPPPPRIKTCPDGSYVLAREPCPPVTKPSKT